ncbi:hypothetical protein [Streptomyces sp. NPDC003710]
MDRPTNTVPSPPTHTFASSFQNAATGSMIDVPADGSGRVITHPPRCNDQQRFTVGTAVGRWYYFGYGGSGGAAAKASAEARARAAARECPGVTPPASPNLVTLRSCSDATAQWRPEDAGEPGGPLAGATPASPSCA